MCKVPIKITRSFFLLLLLNFVICEGGRGTTFPRNSLLVHHHRPRPETREDTSGGDEGPTAPETNRNRGGGGERGREREAGLEVNDYEYDPKGAGVYAKMEEITYPFQQYVQVRKEITVEHLPFKEEHKPTGRNDQYDAGSKRVVLKTGKLGKGRGKGILVTAASSPSHNDEGSEENERSHHQNDEKPRLLEEIDDYKKQEVYEEKGYADGAYDHGSDAQFAGHHNKYKIGKEHQDEDTGPPPPPPPEREKENEEASSKRKQVNMKAPQPQVKAGRRGPYHRPPPEIRTDTLAKRSDYGHMSLLPASSQILHFAANRLFDRDAAEKGIYAARESIHCPEVIDFELSSKRMAMGKGERRKGPRLRGLGGKIKCLKEKYFGVEPLPSAIFQEPEESRHSLIQVPTSMDDFWKEFRFNVLSNK